ncbi:hypothetical protein [Flavobacterium sp. LB1P71]|uniref:hypothetical protein n=1 Tax=unclassified Flavobacterium TaxID=196869 RepID=UPI003AAF39E5
MIWKFTAFIQPTENIEKIINGLDEPYIFHEITLKASELKFLTLDYHEENQKFDIIVFLKNYNLYQLTHPSDCEKMKYIPDNNEELTHLYDLKFYTDEINTRNKD